MKITDLVDAIQKLRSKRDLLVETYDSQLETLRGELETRMKAENVAKATGETASAYFQKSYEVTVSDWGAVQTFVQDHDAFDILQRRIAPAALAARLGNGAHIEGVELKEGQTLFVRALKEKANA